MNTPTVGTPDPPVSLLELVKTIIVAAINRPKQPSAWELVQSVEEAFGIKARWLVRPAIEELIGEGQLPLFPQSRTTRIVRDYFASLLDSEDLDQALRGTTAPSEGRRIDD